MTAKKYFIFFIIINLFNVHAKTVHYHTIKGRDSLMTISNQYYGTHQCWQIIYRANPKLLGPNQLEVGGKLAIPHIGNCKHPNVGLNLEHNLKTSLFRISKELIKDKKKDIIFEKTWAQSMFADIVSNKCQHNGNNQISKKEEHNLSKKHKFKLGYFNTFDADKYYIYDKNGQHIRNTPVNYGPEINTIKKDRKSKKKYTIQVASYPNIEKAQDFINKLKGPKHPIRIRGALIKDKGRWFRLHLGSFDSIKKAKEYIKKHQLKKCFANLFITRSN